jgi:hypothetical protein
MATVAAEAARNSRLFIGIFFSSCPDWFASHLKRKENSTPEPQAGFVWRFAWYCAPAWTRWGWFSSSPIDATMPT